MKTSPFSLRVVAVLSLALIAFAATLKAQITVSWGTESEGRYFATASGSLLPEGSLVRLGSFVASTDFAGHASDLAYLSSQFTVFGTAFIGGGGFTGTPGAFAAANVVPATNTRLSYWAFDAATAAAATQWGIYTETTGLWTTPALAPGSINTDIVDANLASIGTLTATQARTAAFGAPSNVPDSSLWFLDGLVIGAAVFAGRIFKRRLAPR